MKATDPIRCMVCGKLYKAKLWYNLHMSVHHEEARKKGKRLVRQKKFGRIGHLYHEREKSGGKKHG